MKPINHAHLRSKFLVFGYLDDSTTFELLMEDQFVISVIDLYTLGLTASDANNTTISKNHPLLHHLLILQATHLLGNSQFLLLTNQARGDTDKMIKVS